ncbi:MAG TPA: type II secretion system protein N, partial [Gammaproteobacteria bacterium]|nr:type II secretion system protein N [Gammaproteobacteria bacterium]
MDFTSHVARLKDHTPEQWARTASRRLLPGLTFTFVVVLAYQFAGLTWSVVPAPYLATLGPAMPAGSRMRDRSTDLTSLIDSDLFGEEAVAPVVAAVIDAPDTTLSLRLHGTRTVLKGNLADQAIIDSGGQQRTYEIGQPIDGTSGATLH